MPTASGEDWLRQLGLPLPTGGGRLAYRCMDWSERQDHLAGTLATALLDHYLQRDWLRPGQEDRALRVTPAGEARLLPMLEP